MSATKIDGVNYVCNNNMYFAISNTRLMDGKKCIKHCITAVHMPNPSDTIEDQMSTFADMVEANPKNVFSMYRRGLMVDRQANDRKTMAGENAEPSDVELNSYFETINPADFDDYSAIKTELKRLWSIDNMNTYYDVNADPVTIYHA